MQERQIDVFAGFVGGHRYNLVERKSSLATELVTEK